MDECRAEAVRLERRHGILAVARLIVAGAALALLWPVLGSPAWPAVAFLVPGLLFVALAVVHDRVLDRLRRVRRAAAFHEAALARLEDRWVGRGVDGRRFLDPEHPCAGDLDLFGPGSLFELLCTARTRSGEDRLAAWLREPADAAEIRERQAAVDELRPRLRLREDLAVIGEDLRSAVDPERLVAWASGTHRLDPARLRLLAAACTAADLAALVAWMLTPAGPIPFVLAVAATWALHAATRRRLAPELDGVEQPVRELDLLARLLGRLERERFAGQRLLQMQEACTGRTAGAAGAVARLGRLVALLDWSRNALFAPIGFLLLWRLQVGLAVAGWRRRHGLDLRRWLDALGELEALSSLAGYAFEHPDDPFPALDPPPEVLWEGTGLGHPLLPAANCVRNDVRLDAEQRLLVVTGSNMSGKSTLLRVVGINTVLALAGAPVRARSLRLRPLSTGATMRIQDSLLAGQSRFYAEILRLRRILELTAEPRPVLFLLDELLHGTNSHDRRAGAEALARRLLERGAVGLLTTHDLALAGLEQTLPGVRTGHFADTLEEGTLRFDYRLRPGVSRRTNALDLMRAAGLDL